jgi:hypothetical protein
MSTVITRALPFVLAAMLATAACGDDTSTTAPSTDAPARSNEVFSGRLEVGGSQFYSFQIGNAGTTDVTLTGLHPPGVATANVTAIIGLGLGTPAGTDCALSTALTTAPGLTRQITVSTNVQVYCVKVADIGNLRSAVDYTVRVVHP